VALAETQRQHERLKTMMFLILPLPLFFVALVIRRAALAYLARQKQHRR
jgi:hypothetical protein